MPPCAPAVKRRQRSGAGPSPRERRSTTRSPERPCTRIVGVMRRLRVDAGELAARWAVALGARDSAARTAPAHRGDRAGDRERVVRRLAVLPAPDRRQHSLGEAPRQHALPVEPRPLGDEVTLPVRRGGRVDRNFPAAARSSRWPPAARSAGEGKPARCRLARDGLTESGGAVPAGPGGTSDRSAPRGSVADAGAAEGLAAAACGGDTHRQLVSAVSAGAVIGSFADDAVPPAWRVYRSPMPKTATTTSVLSCPACGHAEALEMPTGACLYVHACSACHALLRPKAGDCCVFCSYGSVPCPPIQSETGGAGRATGRCGTRQATRDADA
jgi:hypothetical protein